ncbi:MAG: putative sulfate/molybdate transporter [Desulfobacterales bacterium]|nr:putative sulfate/molybdate transporter [Desulfobacterales bacterium]MDD4393692.1 putative sulfate/molybdate transporter [Desulfobacterales bacterium]
MRIGPYRFDRIEFAGSLGDLGTLIPLSVALMVVCGLGVTPVLLMTGLSYIFTGLYFRLPIPIQPLKVAAAIAIASPDRITVPVIAAAGILFGAILIILSVSGLIDRLAGFFTRPIIRGIQLGLGLILITKGIRFILDHQLLVQNPESAIRAAGIPLNPLLGILGFFLALVLLSNRRFPSALVLIAAGAAIGIGYGALKSTGIDIGPTPISIAGIQPMDMLHALVLLVIPQIPLTLGNAVIGTADTCRSLFGNDERTQRVTNRTLAMSMGLMNIVTGLIGAMPMCHGAGGLAAHYRFGARTGGSSILIGAIFLIIALVFGRAGIGILSCIPNAVLGILLLFSGLELALLIRDVTMRSDLFVTLLIAGIGFATTNMAIAFAFGIIVYHLIRWKQIQL